jgi:hypothetical protein
MRRLPKGPQWIMFNRLPSNLTEEVFQEFLLRHGLHIPVDHISVKEYRLGTTAMVAVPSEILPMLITWAINGSTLEGYEVTAEMLAHSGR